MANEYEIIIKYTKRKSRFNFLTHQQNKKNRNYGQTRL